MFIQKKYQIRWNRIILTKHSRERINQFNISEKQLKYFLLHAEKIPGKEVRIRQSKKRFIEDIENNVIHYRYGPVIIVVRHDGDFAIVITVYDQQVELRKYEPRKTL